MSLWHRKGSLFYMHHMDKPCRVGNSVTLTFLHCINNEFCMPSSLVHNIVQQRMPLEWYAHDFNMHSGDIDRRLFDAARVFVFVVFNSAEP